MPGHSHMTSFRTAALCLLAALMVLATGLTGAAAQANFDRPGGDYARFSIGSGDPNECALRCERDRRCKSWSFAYPQDSERAGCWLKSTVPARVESTCCVSGVRGAGVVQPQRDGVEMGIDRPGGDYRNFTVRKGAGHKACQRACDGDQRCRAWTYVRPGYIGPAARCYLKHQIRPPQRKPCCISGVVR